MISVHNVMYLNYLSKQFKRELSVLGLTFWFWTHINLSCKLWTCLRKNWSTTSLQWSGNPCTNSLTVCSSNPTTQENTSSKAKIVLWAYPQTLVVLKAFCNLSVSLYDDCYLGVMLWFWPQTLLSRCKSNFFFYLNFSCYLVIFVFRFFLLILIVI